MADQTESEGLLGLLTVTGAVSYVGYRGIIDRPGGCLEGVILPGSVSEADDTFAKRQASGSFDKSDGAENDRPNDEPIADDTVPYNNDNNHNSGATGATDNDKRANGKTSSSKDYCYEGAPSHLYVQCIEAAQKFCNCTSCICEHSDVAAATAAEDAVSDTKDETPTKEDSTTADDSDTTSSLGAGDEYLNDGGVDDAINALVSRNKTDVQLSFKSQWYKPIPIVYGTYLIEPTVIDFYYDEDALKIYLVAGIAQGNIGYMSRVWFGERLIYDRTFSTNNTSIVDVDVTFAGGSEAQKISREFALRRPFGTQPAYRNIAIISFLAVEPSDFYAIVRATTINNMRVEVMERADSVPSLTYDDSHQYSNDFLSIDGINNVIYGTTFNVEDWPDDFTFGQNDPTFVNVMSWDSGYYQKEVPYAVTSGADILQKYLGYNVLDKSYLQFYHPIDFEYDRKRVGVFSPSLYDISVVFNPINFKLYCHFISKVYKCAYATKLSVPPELAAGVYVGVEYFTDLTSIHLNGEGLHFYEQAGDEPARETTITLPKSATGASKIQRVAGSNVFAIFFENNNQLGVFEYVGTDGVNDENIGAAFVALGFHDYPTFEPPKEIWSRYITGDEIFYISRNDEIIHVNINTGAFTKTADLTVENVTSYWYQHNEKVMLFVADNRLWTYDTGRLSPKDISLGYVYRRLVSKLWPQEDVNIDVSTMDSIEIDGFMQDNSYETTIKTLNDLFQVETEKSAGIVFHIPDVAQPTQLHDNFASVKRKQLKDDVLTAELSYVDYSGGNDLTRKTIRITAPIRDRIAYDGVSTASFTLNIVAENYDFRPLLEQHVVSIDGDEITLVTSQNNSLITIGDITGMGRVTHISDEKDFSRTITLEPTYVKIKAEDAPDTTDALSYLEDTTNRDILRPNVLFIPAIEEEDRTDAKEAQVAYSLIEAPSTSINNELGRKFSREIPVKMVLRADLKPDVVERDWDDSYTSSTFDGNFAADITRTGSKIFTSKKYYRTSQGHSFAAHSGIVRIPPPNIPLNEAHRTFHEDHTLTATFHHANTMSYLTNMDRLTLLSSFTDNLLIVGYEMIQYQSFSIHDDGITVTFFGLHRSQRNTGMFSNTHVVGERVYLYTPDTIKPFTLSRWATMGQPYAELRVKGSSNKFYVISDAGSARPLAPTDLRWEYAPGDQYFVLRCKISSEAFRDLFTNMDEYVTKIAPELSPTVGNSGLYVVAHVLNGEFDRHDFEEELIHGRYNERFLEPLIRATFSAPVSASVDNGEVTMRIQASTLHGEGIYPEATRLPIVMHFGLVNEVYTRPITYPGPMWRSGIVGYPAYTVVPKIPNSRAKTIVTAQRVATVLTAPKASIRQQSFDVLLVDNT